MGCLNLKISFYKEIQRKYDIVSSEEYKEFRQYQLDKIVRLSTSQIEPLELKGMLKLISYTDSWVDDYNKELKKVN